MHGSLCFQLLDLGPVTGREIDIEAAGTIGMETIIEVTDMSGRGTEKGKETRRETERAEYVLN